MTADFLVVLDACVLVQAPLRDTLLRLAEAPAAIQKTPYLVGQLREHFGDAWVSGYEPLVERMTNDPKDWHVLAVAVRSGASVIVTYNKRHFPPAATAPWEIEIQGPSTFLKYQYDLSPSVVVDKLHDQARNLGVHCLNSLLSCDRQRPPSSK